MGQALLDAATGVHETLALKQSEKLCGNFLHPEGGDVPARRMEDDMIRSQRPPVLRIGVSEHGQEGLSKRRSEMHGPPVTADHCVTERDRGNKIGKTCRWDGMHGESLGTVQKIPHRVIVARVSWIVLGSRRPKKKEPGPRLIV